MESLRNRATAAMLLAQSRVMLLFTPELTGTSDPIAVLDSVLDLVDVIQIRVKGTTATSNASECHAWTRRVLQLVQSRVFEDKLVLVNDRVDVARALWDEGCAGAHVGQDDTPPKLAREVLGPDALLGLSTHDMRQVALGLEEPVDYLGFGPIHPTATKGYDQGVGAERCWVAASTASLPVFPIGGINSHNVSELANVGRIAVSSAILAASDPRAAAETLRAQLG